MKITTRIEDLTERQIEQATEFLQHVGYEYDVYFTTLYGTGWAFIGIVLMGSQEDQAEMIRLLQEEGPLA